MFQRVSKITVLIISILAAGVFSAFAWMLYLQTPQFVLGEMQRGLSHTQTVHFSVTASGDGTVSLPMLTDLLIGTSGEVVPKNGTFALQGTVDLDLRDLGAVQSAAVGRITAHEAGKEPIEGSGRYTSGEGKRALYFDRVPTADASLRTALQNHWVLLPAAALTVPFLRPATTVALSTGVEEKIRTLFRKTSFFRFEKRLPDAKDAGGDVYTYTVAFRPEALRAFAIVLASLREQRSLRDAEVAQLDTDLSRWQVTEMQLAIRKRDFVLQRVGFSMLYRNPDTQSVLPFTVELGALRWNQPLRIDMPREPVAVRGLLLAAGVGGLSLADTRVDGALTAATGTVSDSEATTSSFRVEMAVDDEDQDGLSATLEAFYGTDPRNPDTDGDGYQDGYEVNHGFNPTGPGALFGFGR